MEVIRMRLYGGVAGLLTAEMLCQFAGVAGEVKTKIHKLGTMLKLWGRAEAKIEPSWL